MTFLKILGRYIITLFAASVLIFLLMRAVPGNPARVALGVNATEEAVAELTTSMGLAVGAIWRLDGRVAYWQLWYILVFAARHHGTGA